MLAKSLVSGYNECHKCAAGVPDAHDSIDCRTANHRLGDRMPSIPRTSALKLASTAHDLGAEALRGRLEQNEAGRWTIGHIEIESWLSRHDGSELVLAAAAIDEGTPMTYTRTCRTCGRDYEGRTCPHCESVRQRLRG